MLKKHSHAISVKQNNFYCCAKLESSAFLQIRKFRFLAKNWPFQIHIILMRNSQREEGHGRDVEYEQKRDRSL